MTIFEISFLGITIAPTYYALMYILGFIAGWFFLKKNFPFKKSTHLDDLFFLIGLGVIIGGRLGYVFLYNFSFYLSQPLKIFAIWEGGMSFHGGLIGVIFAVWYFSRKNHYEFWKLIDQIALIIPIGLAFGRFGNYLNNELYGFANYSWPFAMMIDGVPHFPSPLVEMIGEGILLFIFMQCIARKIDFFKKPWRISGIFLAWYGIFRIFIEFFRLPDSHIGYIFWDFLTIGMIYTLPMILFWVYLLLRK